MDLEEEIKKGEEELKDTDNPAKPEKDSAPAENAQKDAPQPYPSRNG